jgi:hypothetical protein
VVDVHAFEPRAPATLKVLGRLRVSITIYTAPGSPLHCELCDAFLEIRGFILTETGVLLEVVTMEPAADGERTLWRLREAPYAGAA